MNPLSADKLYQSTDPDLFNFETTEELGALHASIGQERASEAIQFGIGNRRDGYNVFAMGSLGIGKHSLVMESFNQAAQERGPADDWCYVHNFDQSYKPRMLHFSPGEGISFKRDIEQLVQEMQPALSGAFESEEYQTRRQEIQEEVSSHQGEEIEAIRKEAEERNLRMMRTPGGLAFTPIKEGEILSPEEFQELPEDERQQIESDIEELQDRLKSVLLEQPRLQREIRERIKELNHEIAGLAIGGLFEELREKYAEHDKVIDYLHKMEEDIIENVEHFLVDSQQEKEDGLQTMLQNVRRRQADAFSQRYEVNVIVDNSEAESAPVIYEENPTYQNLIGRIEYQAEMGALRTNFTLIKGGALHRANGGYLLLDARKVLLQPFTWEGLKRALRFGEIRIESPRQMSGMISTASLEPDSIPLDIKVALIGDRQIYYMLNALDPEFGDLFKVVADFNEQMGRSDENAHLYARIIGSMVNKLDLRPLDRRAIVRVIERSARLIGDGEKLTTNVSQIEDLLSEADYWADKNGNGIISDEDVQKAIDAQIHRVSRLRERVQESILRDTILIDTEGKVTGQVNGLSIIPLGDFMFGRPSRITARIHIGEGKVINIEREVELSGPIHSKGVLILSGYLGARYAIEQPLAFSATLVFEQSYGGVDGDSASSAELYALLSALAGVPIRQDLAVTGSVSQRGDVQAIGGVNEKIEGFFDICQARGLTGSQGVLIPESNIKNLMLRSDVIAAVEAGNFSIYPVSHVDQGIEILTEIPAGSPDEKGDYPDGTINQLVKDRLSELASLRMKFRSNHNGE